MLIGIILLVVPLGFYAYEFMYITPGIAEPFNILGIKMYLLKSFWTVLQGIIPPFVILIGLFIIWLELDEWRIEKELRTEEKKEKKKKKE
jgi:hypothetical protein